MPKYKSGDIVASREIIRYVASLGKTHIYKVMCRVCKVEVTMSECSLIKSNKCRVCRRKKIAKATFK